MSTGLAFRQSNGRPPRRDPIVVLVDELTPDDLEAMDSEGPHHSAAPVSELKPSHHAVARYFAVGLLAVDVARVTGYSQVTLSLLMKSPAFQELLHFYRDEANQAAYDVGEKINLMTNDTLAELHQRVLQTPENLSTDFLRKLATDLMDRHPEGHAPVHRSVTKSVHVGLTLDDIREIDIGVAVRITRLHPLETDPGEAGNNQRRVRLTEPCLLGYGSRRISCRTHSRQTDPA